MAVSDAYNFREVHEQLSTAGVVSEQQLADLKAEGYQAVINLLPTDSPYAIDGEADIVTDQGIDYTNIEVDFAAPTASDFDQFVTAMQANGERKLLLHCAANYRVTAFYAIYAVKHLGWSRQQAYDFIGGTWDLTEKPVWEAFVAEMLG